jgi:hypothetical protein
MQLHNAAHIAIRSHKHDRAFVLCYTIYLIYWLVSYAVEAHLSVLLETNREICPLKVSRPDWMNHNEFDGIFRKCWENLITYASQRST